MTSNQSLSRRWVILAAGAAAMLFAGIICLVDPEGPLRRPAGHGVGSAGADFHREEALIGYV